MRKGFALVEMLGVIAIIAVLSTVLAALTRPLVFEIPRTNRIVQANTSVLNMLSHLRDDTEAAVRLPDSFEQVRADDKNLLIELPDNTVCYILEENKVIRKILMGSGSKEAPSVWAVPKTKIHWRRWQKDGGPYAVEVGHHIEYKQGTHIETKLANNHVYFVGASAEAIRNK